MPKKIEQQEGYVPHRFYLNGEPVDKLPQEALDVMAERLSRVVSQYFSQHPDEYEAFLKSRKNKQEICVKA